uniref:Uncharacterized protein n=1 Tax=Anguilla anguilla TaxID=7936 RepID=A0A0E9UCI8_ANGAN
MPCHASMSILCQDRRQNCSLLQSHWQPWETLVDFRALFAAVFLSLGCAKSSDLVSLRTRSE